MHLQKKKSNKAFTLVELLLSLTIMAFLMTALAVAFHASTVNYRANDDLFKSINQARQALVRMTTELRTATAVDTTASTTQCSLLTASGEDIKYQFNNSEKKTDLPCPLALIIVTFL